MNSITTQLLTNYILGTCSVDETNQVNKWISASNEHSKRFFELCEQLSNHSLLLQHNEQEIALSQQKTFSVIKQTRNESALKKLQRYSKYATFVLAMSYASLQSSSFLNNESKVIQTNSTGNKK